MSQVAIVGVGQTRYKRRHEDLSSRELIWQASLDALNDANLDIKDVDVIVTGVAPDALAGEGSVERSAMMGIGKPFVRVNTGGVTGASAVFAGASYIKARRAKAVLAVALERMGQASTSQSVFNTIFDPVYEKDFPLTTITMAALRASMLMRLYGYTHWHWAAIAARNYQNALRNPLAHLHMDLTPEDVMASPMLSWPVHRYEACPMSEGACAVVMVDRSMVGNRKAAWIRGSASTSDAYAMGDRIHRPEATLVDLLSLRLSARRAYEEAGVTDPTKQIRVAELYSAFSSAEAMAYPALGFCTATGGPKYVDDLMEGRAPTVFNPSGGPQGANPVSATAMVRIAECALQVRGMAGARQIDGAEMAVATGQGGATQFSTACVLSSRAE